MNLEVSRPPQDAIQEFLRSRLAGGAPPDQTFDDCLPDDLKLASHMFWTPLEVVARASAWLNEVGVRTIVDIGSGVGKFCIAGALLTDCLYLGIEHRSRLVDVSCTLSKYFGVEDRVTFIAGRFGDVCVTGVDVFYLYNPFGENHTWYGDSIDETVALGRSRYRHDVALVERLLDAAQPGVHLLTYAGFGGRVPSTFCEVRVDDSLPNVLRMWRKESTYERP